MTDVTKSIPSLSLSKVEIDTIFFQKYSEKSSKIEIFQNIFVFHSQSDHISAMVSGGIGRYHDGTDFVTSVTFWVG